MIKRATDHFDPDPEGGTQSTAELMAESRIPEGARAYLRELGFSLNSFTQGELQAINIAIADGHLIDDPNGTTLLDKLTLTADEAAKQRALDDDGIPDDIDDDIPENLRPRHKSFVALLKEQQAKKVVAAATGECLPHLSNN